MTELEIKTTNEINEWFSQDIADFQFNCNDYKGKNQNESNVLLGLTVNKKWVSVKSIKDYLRSNQEEGLKINLLKELQND